MDLKERRRVQDAGILDVGMEDVGEGAMGREKEGVLDMVGEGRRFIQGIRRRQSRLLDQEML
jgi:hypothetical protein